MVEFDTTKARSNNSDHSRDKAIESFLLAVEQFPAEEFQVNLSAEARSYLKNAQEGGQVVLMGETHGVQQNALAIEFVARVSNVSTLALEWPVSMQGLVDRYLATSELLLNWFPSVHTCSDGRITAGHFAVMKRLHDKGLLERVICIDSSCSADANSRDRSMANCLADCIRGDSGTLIAVGSMHARTSALAAAHDLSKGATFFHPLGEHLVKAYPDLRRVHLSYLGGYHVGLVAEDDNSDYVFGHRAFSTNAPVMGTPQGYLEGSRVIIQIHDAKPAYLPLFS